MITAPALGRPLCDIVIDSADTAAAALSDLLGTSPAPGTVRMLAAAEHAGRRQTPVCSAAARQTVCARR